MIAKKKTAKRKIVKKKVAIKARAGPVQSVERPAKTTKQKKPKKNRTKKPGRVTKKEAEEILKKQAEKISEKDLGGVLRKSDEIRNKFESHGPLGRFIDDVKLLISIVQDYWNGRYRDVPYWTIAAIAAALLYVLNPLDLIPDFLPGIGLIDDVLVMGACLAMVETDLQEYKQWKIENPE